MKLTIILAAVVAFASQATMASLPVDADQLAAWQEFFDATGGLTWTRCKGKRDSPCTCTGTTSTVVCTAVDGTNFIKEVRLANNNLAAASYPSGPINNIIAGYTGFTVLDLQSNTKLKNPGGACLPIPACSTTGVKCKFTGVSACAGTAPPVTTSAPTAPAPTSTKAPTMSVKAAWSDFFTATNGNGWTKCGRTQNDPCLCQVNQPSNSPIRVSCTGSQVNKIRLINNNLVSDNFPTADVGAFIAAGATVVDLSSNPGMAPNAECFDYPAECSMTGVTCTFDKPACSSSVTSSPTPVVIPVTGSPSSAPPTTVTPTSAAPTTAAPTTKAPTTAAPTTAAPTTAAPTTVAPSNPPGTTGAPTATTAAPTPGGSATKVPTVAPTNGGEVTSSPVAIGPGTNAPSSDATVAVNGLATSFIVAVVAVMMM